MKSDAAQRFFTLGHDFRLDVLYLLGDRARTLADLRESLASSSVPQTDARHMLILRGAGLVEYSMHNGEHLYSLTDLGRKALLAAKRLAAEAAKPR